MPIYNPGSDFKHTSGYGDRVYEGKTEFHPGVDYAAPKGTPIPAASDGIVWYSGHNYAGYGNLVIVKSKGENGESYFTLYAHMNGKDMAVRGDAVLKGDVIGQVGTTGKSSGPHLHFEILNEDAPVSNKSGGAVGFKFYDKTIRSDPSLFDNWAGGEPYGAENPLLYDWWDLGGEGGPSDEFIDELTENFGVISQMLLDAAKKFSSCYISPIVFDLDGDGIELIHVNNGVNFDLDNNGIAEQTGWLGKDDGFLVKDLNNNGKIDNQTEMFGTDNTSTALQKLIALDTNGNGKVDGTELSALRIWKDINQDGITQTGELQTLAAAGIDSIPTTPSTNTDYRIQGNILDWQATWLKADGTAGGKFGDVFFQTNQLNGWYVGAGLTTPTINPEALLLPLSRSYGALKPLHLAASEDAGVMQSLQAIAGLSLTQLNQADEKMADLLYHWTGMTATTPESGSIYYNARNLGVLEQFFNHDFKVTAGTGAGSDYPQTPLSTEQLSDVWAMMWQVMKARMMVQGALSPVFSKAYYSFEQDDIVFNETLTEVLDRAKTLAPVELTQKDTYWREVGHVLVVHADKFGGDVAAVKTALNTAASKTISIFESTLTGQVGAENFEGSLYADLITTGTGDDTVNGLNGDDSIDGGTGADSLLGGSGNDTLYGGVGGDALVGGLNDDDYMYHFGDGADTVADTGDNTLLDSDVIHITDFDFSAAVLSRVGTTSDVKISFSGNTTDSITITKGLEEGANTIERVVFRDGTELSNLGIRQNIWASYATAGNDSIVGWNWIDNELVGAAGNDTLVGSVKNDTLYGGVGNDSLSGKSGHDAYRFEYGGGNDTVSDSGYSTDSDTIKLIGINLEDTIFRRVGNSTSFKITFANNTTDSISVAGGLDETSATTLETVTFDNGVVKTLAEIRTEVLAAQVTTGNDSITGWTWVATSLEGGAGNDTLTGNGYQDTLYGDAGNDSLTGNSGNDTYRFVYGGGNDTVYDSGYSTDYDTLAISGYNLAETTIKRVGNSNSFKVTFANNAADSIVVTNGLDADANTLERIVFDDGSVKLIEALRLEAMSNQKTTGNDSIIGGSWSATLIDGGAGNDTLVGVAYNDTLFGDTGNDSMRGESGNDTYYYLYGGGNDTIYDSGYGWDNDKLEISGYDLSNTTFSRVANSTNLKITFTASLTDSIVVTDGLDDAANGTLEQIIFNNSTTKTITELRGEVLAAQTTSGNDSIAGWSWTASSIEGAEGNDTLVGSGYADTLSGGIGNDSLSGANGADILIGGQNLDALIGGSGADTFKFNNGDSGTGTNADKITDFSRTAGDKIQLIGFGLSASSFVGINAMAAGGDVEFGYSKLTDSAGAYTLIKIDADNNGISDQEIRLSGIQLDLIASDFII